MKTEYEKQFEEAHQRHTKALQEAGSLVKDHSPEADEKFWTAIQMAKQAKADMWRLEQRYGAHI